MFRRCPKVSGSWPPLRTSTWGTATSWRAFQKVSYYFLFAFAFSWTVLLPILSHFRRFGVTVVPLMSEGFGLLWSMTKGVFGRLQPAPVVDQPGSFVVSRRAQHVSCPQGATECSRLSYLRCTCHIFDSLSRDFDTNKLLSPLQ